MLSILRTQVLLQMHFGLLSIFPTLMQLSMAVFTQCHVRNQGVQGNDHLHDSVGTLDSDVCMALLDYISHGP